MLRSTGLVTARHSLDGVELVASLVRHDPGLVQLWYTEWLVPELADYVHPDQLVVLDTGEASALLLVEVDESTERPPVIRERLQAYARLFAAGARGWHLLWVTESAARLDRIRQIARALKAGALAEHCWGVSIGDVSERGGSADALPVGWAAQPRPLRAIATDPHARQMTPIPGTSEWVAFIATGALETWTSGIRDGVARDGGAVVVAPAPPAPSEPERPASASPTTQADDAPAPLRPEPIPPGASEPDSRSTRPAWARPVEQLDPWLVRYMSADLARLILDEETAPERAIEAAHVLVARDAWPQLDELVEALCASDELARVELGIAIICRVADRRPRGEFREILLRLIDPERGSAVVNAALAALEQLVDPVNAPPTPPGTTPTTPRAT